MLRSAPTVALGLALALCLAPGCGDAPSGPELLSWQLADGRDCATAGVNNVELRTTVSLDAQPIAIASCPSGLAPATFTADDVPGDGTLYLDGVDVLGIDLYHGELDLEAHPPGTGETRAVTLYAAAAE